MSEETPPAKKAARKSVRKKTASKRAPRKKASSASSPEEELPLVEAPSAEESKPTETDLPAENATEAAPKPRAPKSGVRDARRETADEPIADEVCEKLVPDDAPQKEVNKEQPREKQNRDTNSNPNQNQNERRGRGRGRGRNDRNDNKREPKPRIEINSKDLAKKAWKIFESEVTEEGLALLDDNGLRDYARSSFNAARLFLEEEGRVLGRQKADKKARKERGKAVESDGASSEA